MLELTKIVDLLQLNENMKGTFISIVVVSSIFNVHEPSEYVFVHLEKSRIWKYDLGGETMSKKQEGSKNADDIVGKMIKHTTDNMT